MRFFAITSALTAVVVMIASYAISTATRPASAQVPPPQLTVVKACVPDPEDGATFNVQVVNAQATPVAGPAEIQCGGEVTFDTVDASDSYAAAELLFSGTLAIQIPPRTSPTAPTQVHHVTRAPQGARVFALTSHTHHLGILTTVNHADLGGATGGTVRDLRELHRSTNWAEPPLTTFDPPLTFAPSEGLHLACSYVNPTDRAVNFGLSANDEMCFLWAYYYVPR